eukprot:CAMPEP_0197036256 /NCGR_PEP_ID=MMETSP1384-20130603/13823_1 /TAXON_ID=29189 /ORGANISM="Ammonia sp." /LENGTH=456 /DNA_ID=CAMNT_0042466417 /DNA_START=78 /DNA_END=1448 /DNA_ORIENTATION=+
MENANKLLKTILPTNKKDSLSELGPVDTLSLALIIEYHNEDSFWKPYLQCLPNIDQIKNELEYPLYWTHEEIREHLQTSKTGLFLARRLESIHESFNEINAVLQSISYMKDILSFTFDDWIWALSIVWSRSFSVMIDHRKMKCLVPFGDLFNFDANLNEVVVEDLTKWNQSEYGRDLMRFDVQSFTSTDGEHFVFTIRDDTDGRHTRYEAGVQLYAEYSVEVRPNFMTLLDYGFCIKDNPMDGVWITIEDILNSLKFADKFKTMEIKRESQEFMKNLIETMQFSQIFLTRSFASDFYLNSDGVSLRQQQRFVEPYAYTLFLMSLILNAQNSIKKFGDDLLNFRSLYPQIKSNQDIMAVVVQILNDKLKSRAVASRLVQNAWNTANNYVKKEMAAFETTLVQDLMIREQLDASSEHISLKQDCGLAIRIDEKWILLTAWTHLQRLRDMLLVFVEKPA